MFLVLSAHKSMDGPLCKFVKTHDKIQYEFKCMKYTKLNKYLVTSMARFEFLTPSLNSVSIMPSKDLLHYFLYNNSI